MSAPRHPLAVVLAVAGLAAAAAVAAFFLVVLPLLNAATDIPGWAVHSYEGYWNGVDQQFRQIQQQEGGDAP
jgi:hypothetical protein